MDNKKNQKNILHTIKNICLKLIVLPSLLILGKMNPANAKDVRNPNSQTICKKKERGSNVYLQENFSEKDSSSFDAILERERNSPHNRRVSRLRERKKMEEKRKLNQQNRRKFQNVKKIVKDENLLPKILQFSFETEKNLAKQKKIYNTIQKNNPYIDSYFDYINQQIGESKFLKLSKLSTLREIGDNGKFLDSILTEKNFLEFLKAEQFLRFITISTIPISGFVGKKMVEKILQYKAGFDKPKEDENTNKKEKNEENVNLKVLALKNFITIIYIFFKNWPVGMFLAFNFIRFLNKYSQLENSKKGWFWQEKETEEKKKIYRKLEQILNFMIFHPGYLFLIFFCLSHYNDILALLELLPKISKQILDTQTQQLTEFLKEFSKDILSASEEQVPESFENLEEASEDEDEFNIVIRIITKIFDTLIQMTYKLYYNPEKDEEYIAYIFNLFLSLLREQGQNINFTDEQIKILKEKLAFKVLQYSLFESEILKPKELILKMIKNKSKFAKWMFYKSRFAKWMFLRRKPKTFLKKTKKRVLRKTLKKKAPNQPDAQNPPDLG